jgi:hypothetical protein
MKKKQMIERLDSMQEKVAKIETLERANEENIRRINVLEDVLNQLRTEQNRRVQSGANILTREVKKFANSKI